MKIYVVFLCLQYCVRAQFKKAHKKHTKSTQKAHRIHITGNVKIAIKIGTTRRAENQFKEKE